MIGGPLDLRGPSFDQEMALDSYAWWYLDALSDDGRHGIVVIAMLGSAFSPYYAAARSRRPSSPLDYVTMNVAVYGPSSRRWAMTERRGATRGYDWLSIGPSSMRWEGDVLVVDIDEVTAPIASKLRGRVRLVPETIYGKPQSLDARGVHRWWPIAPKARVFVDLDEPKARWAGTGYFDANAGEEPLESGFSSWTWSRLPTPRGAVISYSVRRRDGTRRILDLEISPSGADSVDALVEHRMPRTRWRLDRAVRASKAAPTGLVRTLEDTPFYSRSAVRLGVGRHSGVAVHESVSLDRFASRWVRTLLPVRIRRAST